MVRMCLASDEDRKGGWEEILLEDGEHINSPPLIVDQCHVKAWQAAYFPLNVRKIECELVVEWSL